MDFPVLFLFFVEDLVQGWEAIVHELELKVPRITFALFARRGSSSWAREDAHEIGGILQGTISLSRYECATSQSVTVKNRVLPLLRRRGWAVDNF